MKSQYDKAIRPHKSRYSLYQMVLLTPVLNNCGRKHILTAAWKRKEIKECFSTISWITELKICARETWDTKAIQRINKIDKAFRKS